MPDISGVYKIQSIVHPERCYIGSALNIRKRWTEHLRDLRHNKHANKKLQNHFNKHGELDLVFTIIEPCLPQFLTVREDTYFHPLPFFNICPKAGSTLGKPAHNKGVPMSEEAKVKLRASRKLQVKTRKGIPQSAETIRRVSEFNKGKKHSIEHKKKISEGLKGRVCSEETKRKISEAQKGKKRPWQAGEKHPYYGKEHSLEVREKIKQARRKQTNTRKGVPCSEETKQKLRKANLGKKMSEDTKQKMRETMLRIGNKPPSAIGVAPWNKGLKKKEGVEGKITKLKVA